MAGIAFFDLDRTILDCNSATLWVKRQVREGRMKRTDALKMAGMIVMYQLGSGNIDRAVKQAIYELKGQREDEIRRRTRSRMRRLPGAYDRVSPRDRETPFSW